MQALIRKTIAIACICALSLLALCGCADRNSGEASEAQKANRAYMSQVNEAMDALKADLGGFVDAVSRDDVVNMRTQADNAFKRIDKLEALTAPDALSDVHAKFIEGAKKLKSALDGYVALYAEIRSATDEKPFDWSNYESRIAAIQAQYNEGVSILEEGDKLAADKS